MRTRHSRAGAPPSLRGWTPRAWRRSVGDGWTHEVAPAGSHRWGRPPGVTQTCDWTAGGQTSDLEPVPGPLWEGQAVGDVVGRLRVGVHDLDRPVEPVHEGPPQLGTVGDVGVVEGLCEALLGPAVHLVVLAVPGVHPQDRALVAHARGEGRRSGQLFAPVRREPLGVVVAVPVAERVADDW